MQFVLAYWQKSKDGRSKWVFRSILTVFGISDTLERETQTMVRNMKKILNRSNFGQGSKPRARHRRKNFSISLCISQLIF